MWRSRLLYLLGGVILILSLVGFLPFLVALARGESQAAEALLTGITVSGLVGAGLYLGFRGVPPVRTPALTVLLPSIGTFALALTGALPFFFFRPDDGLAVAVFEGMSFITTSGSSAYPAVDQPVSLHLWRALLAWIGGFMAIIYALSFLTAVNSGGQQLHYSPLPFGDSREGYTRLYSTAGALLPLYIIITSAFALLFMGLGVPSFQSFSLAVSGVSTTALPVLGERVNLPLLAQIVFLGLMLLGASNWDMLQAMLVGKRRSLMRDPESRQFMSLVGLFVLALVLMSFVAPGGGLWSGFFHLVSAATGTGLMLGGSEALNAPTVAFGALVLCVAAVGGASISTTGGIKQLRLAILLALARAELDRLAHPHGARRIHIGRAPLTVRDGEAVYLLLGGFVISLMAGALLLGIQGVPFVDSLALGFAALTLSGPTSEMIVPGSIGYTALTNSDYMILSALMLVGRIEATFLFALGSRLLWRG